MANEFQRVMDSILKNIPFLNCYTDDILASRGSLEDHKAQRTRCDFRTVTRGPVENDCFRLKFFK